MTNMEMLKMIGLTPPPGLKIPENATGGLYMTPEWLQNRAALLNSTSGHLQGPDCPQCRNRGYIAVVRDGAVILQECDCIARRHSVRLLKKSGLGDLLDYYTFESFQTPEPWQARAKEMAMDWVRQRRGWLVCTGRSGTGKTHLCTAAAGALLQAGLELRYMRWRQDAPGLKALVTEPAAYARALEPLQRAPVLYIDDFFKGAVTEADKNLAFSLLDARYADRRLLTILSSERSIEAILELDEAIGGRIYERAAVKLRFDGENYRLRRG